MKETIFTGAAVALVTPFNPDMSVNYEELEKLIEFQITSGTDAIVTCGTTGEAATLTDEEHVRAQIELACDLRGKPRTARLGNVRHTRRIAGTRMLGELVELSRRMEAKRADKLHRGILRQARRREATRGVQCRRRGIFLVQGDAHLQRRGRDLSEGVRDAAEIAALKTGSDDVHSVA